MYSYLFRQNAIHKPDITNIKSTTTAASGTATITGKSGQAMYKKVWLKKT